MSFTSPPFAYVLGAGSVLLGLHCVARPRAEYGRFGLPLEFAPHQKNGSRSSDADKNAVVATGHASPLMHLKGIREITYGLVLGTLQYLGEESALTAVAGVISFAGLGDAIVIWLHSGPELWHRAFGHLSFFFVCAGWSWWRATS